LQALYANRMRSSREQQQQQQQQEPHACCFDNPGATTPLLKHPSISKDQRVLLLLQQTSKQLQTAVAEHCTAQLPAVLQTQEVQQAAAFCSWLHKHSCLLQSLHVHLISSARTSGSTNWCLAVAALAAALQDAAAAGALQLQHFTLRGSPASSALLQALSAAQLTQLSLDVEFDLSSYSSSHQHSTHTSSSNNSSRGPHPVLQELTALTALRCLRITGKGPTAAADENDQVLALLASLQQLTHLSIGLTRPEQLPQLPPKLQQLHIAVDLGCHTHRVVELAQWLKQHRSRVVSLQLGGLGGPHAAGWAAAISAVGETSLAQNFMSLPTFERMLQLEHGGTTEHSLQQVDAMKAEIGAPWAPILQRLHPSVVKHLVCPVDFCKTAQTQALCALTGLQSLWVCEAKGSLHRQPGKRRCWCHCLRCSS
jgi:hypothetical protein